jgi:hypothetical protein
MKCAIKCGETEKMEMKSGRIWMGYAALVVAVAMIELMGASPASK